MRNNPRNRMMSGSQHLWILVAAGSALGGVARMGLNALVTARAGELFPWGTLVVNLAGSFLIGLVAGLGSHGAGWIATIQARHFLITGCLGGFTTFSAFSLQALQLIQQNRPMAASLYAAASAAGCVLAAAIGWQAGVAQSRLP